MTPKQRNNNKQTIPQLRRGTTVVSRGKKWVAEGKVDCDRAEQSEMIKGRRDSEGFRQTRMETGRDVFNPKTCLCGVFEIAISSGGARKEGNRLVDLTVPSLDKPLCKLSGDRDQCDPPRLGV